MAVEILRISWIDMGVGSSSFVGVLAVATSDLSGRRAVPKSLPPMGKVARAAGRKRSSLHVAIRAYTPIDVISATRS